MSIRTDIFQSLVDGEGDEDAADLTALVVPESVLANRYRLSDKLGEGGMAVVHLARDRALGRDVALKSIPPDALSPKRLARFVTEARITAQLQHPGIIPIHDLFVSAQGEVFYSMKQIQGRSLREALGEIRRHSHEAIETYTVNHLMNIFLHVCQAVGYAHSRGVVHRDLKPDNIMLGDFGEVLVMDWGLAKPLGEGTFTGKFPILTERKVTETTDDVMVGSPAYMAPETLPGRDEDAHYRTDVYALGVTLYELLCGRRPYEAESLPRLLYLVAKGELTPPQKRSRKREIPDELQAICLKALAGDPEQRYDNAVALAEAIGQYLSGVRPREEASNLCAEGRKLLTAYDEQANQVGHAELHVHALSQEMAPWDPVETKRAAWLAEQELADAVAEADRLFGDSEAAFESALSHVRDFPPAREGLADLCWLRFLQAEARDDTRWMRRWEELILRHDPKRYEARLDGAGTLTIDVAAPGATVRLFSLVDREGRRLPADEQDLSTSSGKTLACPMGSYRIEVSAKGSAPLTIPIQIRRQEDLHIGCSLVDAAAIRDGFVHIPGGAVILGGDDAALDPQPPTLVHIPGFALARHPTTVAEYLAFLADLSQNNPDLAVQHAPQARVGVGIRTEPLFVLPDEGPFVLPFRDRDGVLWQADLPVVSVTAEAAEAYAVWLSAKEGGPTFRLPTDSEWEKAARGADRRLFPWGDRFDATYCSMAESREGGMELVPVSTVDTDVSPYGIRDLGGGVRDWVAWDDPSTAPLGKRLLRGGSYGTVAIYSRCASRSEVPDRYVGSHVGFRLAHDLP